MVKRSWKAYQTIQYQHARMKEPIECLLIEIDFDDESMTLQPMLDEEYRREDFIANIKHCSIPRKKMTAAAINGKKVIEELPPYDGSTNKIDPNYHFNDDDIPDKAS